MDLPRTGAAFVTSSATAPTQTGPRRGSTLSPGHNRALSTPKGSEPVFIRERVQGRYFGSKSTPASFNMARYSSWKVFLS